MKTIFAILILVFSVSVFSAVPAFPGAEGWGAGATGGRGGQIIHVTNLAGSGSGTFRAACAATGAKIIVFDVSGVIDLGSSGIDLNSNTTIEGQTSPGGITLTNCTLFAWDMNNIIIRHLRIRRSMDVPEGDCMTFVRSYDIIVDHCSTMWNSDETIDLAGCHNVTLMNCNISEPGYCWFAYGGGPGQALGNNRTILLGDKAECVTLYRNLFAEGQGRVPCLTNEGLTSPVGKTFEVINNAIYNCQSGGESFYDHNNIPLNLIANWYRAGTLPMHEGQTPPTMYVHAADNYRYPSAVSIQPQYQKYFFLETSCRGFIDTVIPPQKTNTISTAAAAYNWLIACAGPLPHDSADNRISREVQLGTGKWVDTCRAALGTDPLITSGPAKPTDTDNDGIPDAWETAHGLNLNNAADAVSDMGGYNAIEVYANALSDTLEQVALRNFAPANGIEQMPVQALNNQVLNAGPNPLNAGTSLNFSVPSGATAELAIYTLQGQKIRVWNIKGSGVLQTIHWDGKNNGGLRTGAGVYLCKLQSAGERKTIRLLLAE